MTSISLAEYHKQYAPKAKPKAKRSKYNAQRIEKDGMKFDSVKEYKRYIELTALMQRGEISELKCQVKFVLAPKVKLEGEKRIDRALPFLDQAYIFIKSTSCRMVIFDAKGILRGEL